MNDQHFPDQNCPDQNFPSKDTSGRHSGDQNGVSMNSGDESCPAGQAGTAMLLRDSLVSKAHSYYPDGTSAPSLAGSSRPDSKSATLSLDESSSRRRGRAGWVRSAQVLGGVAAAVACVVAVGVLATRDGSASFETAVVASATSSAPSPVATGAASAVPDGEGKTQASAADEGVRLVQYPFYCPVEPGREHVGSPLHVTDVPVDPIQYCSSIRQMAGVDPARAVARQSGLAVEVTDRPPYRSAAPYRSDSERLEALRRSGLTAGQTFTGRDYEASFAPVRADLYPDGLCREFDDYVSFYRDAIARVTGGSWKVVGQDPEVGQGPAAGSAASVWCHQPRVDLASRTVFITEVSKDAGTTHPGQKEQAESDRLIQRVMDSVNKSCLSRSEARGVANRTARESKSVIFAQDEVVKADIKAGGSCARLYRHPEHSHPGSGFGFIVFGS